MRALLLFLIVLPGSALAHIGHLGDVAGHDHIAIGVGIGVIIGAAVWGKLRDAAKSKEEDEIAEDDEEVAPA